jgi:uncharacterized repeat protein (TIGR03803 family)
MTTSASLRLALSASIAGLLLVACGGPPPAGAPLGMPQNAARSLAATSGQRASSSAYEVLHRFAQTSRGEAPAAQLIDVNGTLYGTTVAGGKSGDGTVYTIGPSGAEKTLYSFRGGTDDGAAPNAGLVDVNGTLYGTTAFAGATYGSQCVVTDGRSGCGTVFAIALSGKEKVVYSFAGGTDGSYPMSGLIDVRGTLYGTTNEGGSNSFGTVYRVSTTGSEKVLHSFSGSGDGIGPAAGLIDVKGTLYGTTNGGGTGTCDCGTVFSITPAGVEAILHSFAGPTGDGGQPLAGLTDVNGTLYGTTSGGGKDGAQPGCSDGCGTVYAITTAGQESIVYYFTGGDIDEDGSYPVAGLTDVNGTLYGTTSQGGGETENDERACHVGGGCGAVFSITTGGTETVLHRFGGGSDGAAPHAALLDVDGTLYGTTEFARFLRRYRNGRNGDGPGTVFMITP